MGMTKEDEDYIKRIEAEARRKDELELIAKLWPDVFPQRKAPVLKLANPFFVTAAYAVGRRINAVKQKLTFVLLRKGIEVQILADFYPWENTGVSKKQFENFLYRGVPGPHNLRYKLSEQLYKSLNEITIKCPECGLPQKGSLSLTPINDYTGFHHWNCQNEDCGFIMNQFALLQLLEK